MLFIGCPVDSFLDPQATLFHVIFAKHLWEAGKVHGVFLVAEVTARQREGPAVMEDQAARREAEEKKVTGP